MRKLYAFVPVVAMAAVAFPAAPSHAASTLVVSATGVTANCPNAHLHDDRGRRHGRGGR